MTATGDGTAANGDWLQVGVITGVRGLKGEVRIKSFTADPAAIAAYGPVFDRPGGRQYRLKVVGQSKGQVIARLDGIADRTAAEALKGTELFLPRQVLPEADDDEFYHADLIGLRAELVAGDGGTEVLGTVGDVHDYGGGASLEITGGPRGTVMVPFSRVAVPEVDIDGGRLLVNPLPGLLETPEPVGDGTDADTNEDED